MGDLGTPLEGKISENKLYGQNKVLVIYKSYSIIL